MKKSLKTLLGLGFVAAMLSAMTVMASAADPTAGIYEVKATDPNCTLTAQNVSQKKAAQDYFAVKDGEESKTGMVFTDAVRFSLKVTGAAPETTQILVTLQDTAGAPTAGNIRYINQDAAAGGTVTFDLYPDKLEAGKTYTVQVATTGGALKEVGSFKCVEITGRPPYTLGDVDGLNGIAPADATCVLQMFAGIKNNGKEWTANQRLAADVDGINGPAPADATEILKKFAGLPSLLD